MHTTEVAAPTTHDQSPHAVHHHQPGHPAPHTAAEPDAGTRKSWTVLALALTAQILVVLDISVVNTALPAIGASLTLGSSELSWLVTAYLLLSGGGLLLGAETRGPRPRLDGPRRRRWRRRLRPGQRRRRRQQHRERSSCRHCEWQRRERGGRRG